MQWQQPPPAKRGRTSTKWSSVADALKSKPNEWALIGKVKYASQAAIIAKTHGIKVVTRQSSDELYDLYGMYESETEVS